MIRVEKTVINLPFGHRVWVVEVVADDCRLHRRTFEEAAGATYVEVDEFARDLGAQLRVTVETKNVYK